MNVSPNENTPIALRLLASPVRLVLIVLVFYGFINVACGQYSDEWLLKNGEAKILDGQKQIQEFTKDNTYVFGVRTRTVQAEAQILADLNKVRSSKAYKNKAEVLALGEAKLQEVKGIIAECDKRLASNKELIAIIQKGIGELRQEINKAKMRQITGKPLSKAPTVASANADPLTNKAVPDPDPVAEARKQQLVDDWVRQRENTVRTQLDTNSVVATPSPQVQAPREEVAVQKPVAVEPKRWVEPSWLPNEGQIAPKEVDRKKGRVSDFVKIRLTNATSKNLSVKVVVANSVSESNEFSSEIGGPGKMVSPVFEVFSGEKPITQIYYIVND